MLNELAAGFAITIREASLLVTFGAVVMCVGSPLLAWWTSRVDRRVLLATSLGLIALGHLASRMRAVCDLPLRLVQLASQPFTRSREHVQALVRRANPPADRVRVHGLVYSWRVGVPT